MFIGIYVQGCILRIMDKNFVFIEVRLKLAKVRQVRLKSASSPPHIFLMDLVFISVFAKVRQVRLICVK